MFQELNGGIGFKIKVIPNASFNQLVGWENDELRVRIKGIPAKNAANNELIKFLATILKVKKTDIQIIRGLTSRHKQLYIKGLNVKSIRSLLDQ